MEGFKIYTFAKLAVLNGVTAESIERVCELALVKSDSQEQVRVPFRQVLTGISLSAIQRTRLGE